MATYQEKASKVRQEAQNTISQTKKKLNKLIKQLETINEFDYIATSEEDAKTAEHIKATKNIIKELNKIYTEL